MLRFLAFILCSIVSLNALAQKQNANWAFGDGQGISFSNGQPISFNSAYYTTNNGYCPSAVSDAGGNLLFYTDGNVVWNKLHQPMPNGTNITLAPNLNGAGTGAYSTRIQSVVIIPGPGSNNMYLIIASALGHDTTSIGTQMEYRQLRYSVVDMTLNGGLGDVLPANKNILVDGHYVDWETVAAGNGSCKKWVLAKQHKSNRLLAYEVTSTGISNTPVVSIIEPGFVIEMELSQDNKRMAIRSGEPSTVDYYVYTTPEYIHLYNFDVKTGKLANATLLDLNTIPQRDIRGMAFSPDNSKFYYHQHNQFQTPSQIWQYDLAQPTLTDIINSKTAVFSYQHKFSCWDLSNAPNQHIYALLDSGRCVDIAHPDAKGVACAASIKQIPGSWNNNTTSYSPQNPVPATEVSYSYYDFNTCTLPTQLSSYKSNADTYTWSTGATTQSITATANGTYWVKASEACGANRTDTFHVDFTPIEPINDTFICDGSSYTVPQDPSAIYTWHTAGPQITKSGTYAVAITKNGCGQLEDTFMVTIYPPLNATLLPADTMVCNAEAQLSIHCTYNIPPYQWNTGATTNAITVDTPGKYTLQCSTACGVYTDSIYVGFCAALITDIVANDTVCAGSCINIMAKASNYPKHYSWLFEHGTPESLYTTSPATTVCFNDTGNFQITLVATNAGGSDTMLKKIRVLPPPISRFADTGISVTYKTLLLLPACADAVKLSWYKGDELICANCPAVTIPAKEALATYTCVAHNATCADTCTYTVNVTDIPTDIWLPNAFTPNNDGLNDYFRIVSDNPNVQDIALSVYNRFGQMVYRSQQADEKQGWDGRFNGTPCDVGSYFWQLSYKVAAHNDVFYMKGDVILIR